MRRRLPGLTLLLLLLVFGAFWSAQRATQPVSTAERVEPAPSRPTQHRQPGRVRFERARPPLPEPAAGVPAPPAPIDDGPMPPASFPGGEAALRDLGGLLSDELLDACPPDADTDFSGYVQVTFDQRGVREVDIVATRLDASGTYVPDPERTMDEDLASCIEDALWSEDREGVPGVFQTGFIWSFSPRQ